MPLGKQNGAAAHGRRTGPSLWRVSREWEGETVYIVAGGPSAAGLDLGHLRGRRVIAVNTSYQAVPFADILFFGDLRWWIEHRERIKDFPGRLVTVCKAKHERLHHLAKVKPPPGLTSDRSAVVMQRTSLQGAINLAVHLSGGPQVLIGADMQKAPDGRSHHHAPHPWPVRPGCWDEQMAQLRLTARPLADLGVEVVNTSLNSRIGWWPKRPLEECL